MHNDLQQCCDKRNISFLHCITDQMESILIFPYTFFTLASDALPFQAASTPIHFTTASDSMAI
jgi:hypothetical protein